MNNKMMKNPMAVRRILVIRFRRVGDSVLSMALCHGLRQTFPEARIDFVINEGIHTLYEHHPDVDRCIVFSPSDHRFSNYAAKVWKTVRHERYDIIIDMRTTLRTLLFSAFSLFRSPIRIGEKKWYSWPWLSDRLSNHAPGTGSRIDQNNLLLEPLRAIADVRPSTHFRLYADSKEVGHYRQLMEQKGIDFSKMVIIATPTARLEYKVLPAPTMRAILRRIIHTYDAQVIFNFAGKERDIALRYQQELDNDPHIFTNIEAPSLPELCALMKNCDFFFGNEGGPRHISQALDIPSFAIFPPGIRKQIWLPDEGERFAGISPDDFMPREEQEAKRMTYQQRMELLTEERIWTRLQSIINKNRTK